jgi:hypothetical protein
MAELSTIARPYAEALFSAAKASGSLDVWVGVTNELAGLVRHPQVAELVADPKLADGQVFDLLTSLLKSPLPAGGKGDGANFLRMLIENDRLAALPEVACNSIPSEISELIKSQDPEPGRGRRHAQPGHGRVGDRRHLPHPRPVRRDAGRDARVPRQHLRPRAEPRARLGRRGGAGRVRAHLRRRRRQGDRPHSRSAGRPRAARPRGQLAGPADRRQGPDQREDDRRHREGRAGRDRAQVGVAAGADRPEGDRLDGADRPRPARADHRRPPDRQDRGGRRHDHQPEGQGPLLRLRRDRPEGLDRRQRGAQARRARRDGLHDRRRRDRLRVGRDAVHRRRTPAARWASTSATAARTR